MGKGDNKLGQELLAAIQDANLEDVRHIVDQKIKKKDKVQFFCVKDGEERMPNDYETAVLAAAECENSEILRFLIDSGACVNFVSKELIKVTLKSL